jgi:hypothetical protein
MFENAGKRQICQVKPVLTATMINIGFGKKY